MLDLYVFSGMHISYRCVDGKGTSESKGMKWYVLR